MIGERAVGVRASLLEHDSGRADTPFIGTDEVGAARDQEYRADAPDQSAGRGLLRREKQALHHIAGPALPAITQPGDILIDQWDDGARYKIPILVQRDRDHRLDIDRRAFAIPVSTDVAIRVELERHADQRRDGIGQLLRQAFRVLRGNGLNAAQQCSSKDDFYFHGFSFGHFIVFLVQR